MERENGEANTRGVATAVHRLCTVYAACDEASLLRLSYVPQEVVGLLDVRFGAAAERHREARDVRRLRRLQALDRTIPQELLSLEPTDRLQERMWWSSLGLDKESGVLSRQSMWDQIVVSLMDALGAKTGKVSLRRLAVDVCHVLRARYPNLEVPGPELIRKRYYRA